VSALTAAGRLEALKREIEAACNVTHRYQGDFTEGMATGLRIALNAIDHQLQFARDIEAAQAAHQ
jgi:hypothetical protein